MFKKNIVRNVYLVLLKKPERLNYKCFLDEGGRPDTIKHTVATTAYIFGITNLRVCLGKSPIK